MLAETARRRDAAIASIQKDYQARLAKLDQQRDEGTKEVETWRRGDAR